MDSDLRENLSTIVVITLIGIATCAFGLTMVHDNAANMSWRMFSWLVFLVPCAVMLLGSFAVTLVAPKIGRQLFLTMLVVCIALGIVSMVVTSMWTSDPEITAALLANSDPDTAILPILQSPIVILRDIAAFVVCPTVGCIAGAWLGSRLHPVTSTNKKRRKKKRIL